jgi:hypothetical protein
MLAHFAPHFHGGGVAVLLVLICLIVAIALVFAGTSKNKD